MSVGNAAVEIQESSETAAGRLREPDNAVPAVSVIIPCRNEADHIRQVVTSVFDARRPKGGMEVLVVDGMSDDGTREILEDMADGYPGLRILDNPAKTVPHALNSAIRAAQGDVIVRLDAHTYYEPDYIVACVEWLQSSGADNVGGALVVEPSRDTVVGRAIAQTIAHPFGSGNASHKTSRLQAPRDVDTVAFGCFRADLFTRIGLFREDLARSQDMEFNLRLRRAGGRILLVPQIKSRYQARGTLARVIPYYFSNGFWVVFSLKSRVVAFKLRHLVPMAFVGSLIALGALSLAYGWARWLLGPELVLYFTCALLSSAQIALRERRVEYVFSAPPAFLLLHVIHGLGSLHASLRIGLEWMMAKVGLRLEVPTARV